MPDPTSVEQQKTAYARSLDEQLTQAAPEGHKEGSGQDALRTKVLLDEHHSCIRLRQSKI